MNTASPEVRAEALAFLQSIDAGVVATVSKEYAPHAAVVHYVADEHFNIYFATKRNSRKYLAMMAHPQAAFVVGSSENPRTLQIEGSASELTSEEDKAKHLPQLMNVLAKHRPGEVPVGKLDDELVMMWIQPKWIRWADYTKPAIGNENLLLEITL